MQIPVTIRRVRDLRVFDVGDQSIVVACDSSGSIGPKPNDTYAAPAATVAHFALRVALLELLAAGSTPVLAVDALCVERDPTGAEMINAARALLSDLGLDSEAALLGSTEDNVTTTSTGIGVTAIGIAPRGTLRMGSSQADDLVVCLGEPLSAPAHDLYPGHPGVVTVAEVRRARNELGVHDALPVGSHGIRYEVGELAREAGLTARLDPACGLDLDCSGGPATCVLVSCYPPTLDALRAFRSDLPVTVVATLRAAV